MKLRVFGFISILIGTSLLIIGCPANNSPSSPPAPAPTITFTITNTPCTDGSGHTCTPTFTATLSNTPTLTPTITPTATPTPLPFKAATPTDYGAISIGVSPSGSTIYAAEPFGSEVEIFSSPLNRTGAWSSSGSTSYSMPMGVAVDPSTGDVWIADRMLGEIFKQTSGGVSLTSLGGFGAGTVLWNIAVASNGNLYVPDSAINLIYEYSSSGSPVTQWSGYNQPLIVAVSPISPYNVYIGDAAAGKIYEYTASGASVTQWGGLATSSGVGAGDFANILGLAIAANGNVFVADGEVGGGYVDDFIQEFSPTGQFVLQFGGAGTGNGTFNQLSGICFAPNGDLYAADYGNNRIQIFGP